VFKRNFVLLLVPLVLLLSWAAWRAHPAPARADTTPAGNSITVNGTGTVQVVPDEATVTVGAEEDAATAAAAQTALARDTAAMEKAIAGAGIDPKDVTTSGYNLWPSYDNNGKADGYRASSDFAVTIHKLDALGSFLDAMVASGSNRIESIAFQRSDIAFYQRQALLQAVADARAKARAVADQLGRPLGPVTKITENGQGPVPVYDHEASFAVSGAASAPSTVVQPGQLTITASVTLENSY